MSESDKKNLAIEAYNSDVADIMRCVSKPVLTTTNAANKKIPQLHYNSAGTLMIAASAEMELIRQQQAEEFVKKLHDDKEKFEKKIQIIENRIEKREKTELERLREYEERKERQRLEKRKAELDKNLKEIKAKNEERLKEKEEWVKTYKALKESKPRFVQIQENYEKEQEKKYKEVDAKKLKEIRDCHKPINKQELDEHERKFLKHLEEVKAKKEKLQPLKTVTTPANPNLAELLREEKAKQREELEEKRRNRERVESLNQKVKKHRVNIDPAKEEEMRQLIQKLQDQTRSKRSTKGDDPEKRPDENELNMQRTKKLQNLVIAKSMRKYETLNDELEAKKAITTTETVQSPAYPNYWKDVKKQLHIAAHSDDWKNIISSKGLSKRDKTEAILIETGKLEEKAKMKEKLWRAKKGKPDSFKNYVDESEQVDDLYINSIKAKLSLLRNETLSAEPSTTDNQSQDFLSERNKGTKVKNLHNDYAGSGHKAENGPQKYRSNFDDAQHNPKSNILLGANGNNDVSQTMKYSDANRGSGQDQGNSQQVQDPNIGALRGWGLSSLH